MIRRPPRSTQSRSSAASDVYKRQVLTGGAERALLVAPTVVADGEQGKTCVRLRERLMQAELHDACGAERAVLRVPVVVDAADVVPQDRREDDAGVVLRPAQLADEPLRVDVHALCVAHAVQPREAVSYTHLTLPTIYSV